MTRKFVLATALIGFAMILLPSAFFSNAGAYFRKSQSKQQPVERRLSRDRSPIKHRAPQGRFIPTGIGTVVNSTGDTSDAMPGDGNCNDGGGNCTLRAAIEEANALAGPDIINFNLPGAGVRTIAVTQPLPTITTEITIDGTSQPGFAGTPLILLTRANSSVLGDGLTINTNNCEVEGLIISGFAGAGISLQSGGGHFIHRNFFGTDSTGNSALGNGGGGVLISSSNGNIIGELPPFVLTAAAPRGRDGFHPAAFTPNGNLISGNAGAGISIAGASGNRVASNFIGTNAAGTSALGNTGAGVLLTDAPENMIGGDAVAKNLISGNNIGVDIQGAESGGVLVQGNLIGTDATGSAAIGNTLFGVRISGASVNGIGGDPMFDEDNTIAFNGDDGVAIVSGSQNRIRGNSIFSNGGLGIDLGPSGVTPNDTCDSDTGANSLQNFPVLTSAVIDGSGLTIDGTLEGEPILGYTIEFFSNSACDPSGNGEGRQLIGSVNVATGMPCPVTFNANFPTVPPGTSFVTATATSEMGNTSEFSPCLAVTGGVNADLAISKTDSPDPVQAGAQLTYTILVTNNGPDPAANVVVTDIISPGAGYTFSSVTSSQGSCVTPAPGGTGTVTCTPGTINSGATVTISLIVNVTVAVTSSTTITNTTSVTSETPDSNTNNNTATASTTVVTATSCVINCQPNITVDSSTTRCGARVTYPLPTTSGPCESVVCTPSSGSFFPVGTTTVTCTEGFATCSFFVTVIDNIAPRITCPENISVGLDQGQRTKVVTYSLPLVIDNCSVFSNNCTPPSGATFPIGTTTVNCSASDLANNISTCSFTVTVVDNQPPTIVCPGNVVVQGTAGQCSTVVNYPSPNIPSGPTGTFIVCSPPAASTFPPGTTAVTCTAITPSGLRSSCSFNVVVNGPPQALLTLNGNKSALDFGPTDPVRKPKKKVPSSCDCTETFTIENTGCSVLGLNLASIMRTGSDVDSGKITDPDDSKFFTVTIVNPDGSERSAECNTGAPPCITINPGQRLTFRVAFKPVIPAAFSGKTRGLAASEVVPDRITSKITFNQQGGSPIVINMVGRVSTALRLIDPDDPRKPKRVILTRSGNELTVTYAIFDSNLDVNRARFEFFNDQGGQVGQAIDVDLAGPISSANLVKGQSFVVVQRFTGAQDNPEATSVRVTVFDAESSDTDTGKQSSSSAVVSFESQALRRGAILFPPRSRVNP